MYGVNQYGLIQYAENIAGIEEIEANSPDLMKYLPTYYANSNVMQQIQKANALEIGRINYNLNDLLNQFFVDTATWGLIYWENEYGIQTNLSMSYEDRRTVIKAKKRGQGTTTKVMIKNVAEAFSGGEVNIIEDNTNYTFIVQFVGIKGIPTNMQTFKNMLEDIKPAHLAYIFKYTYTIWNLLKEDKLTYNNAKLKSWDELKVYE